MIKKTKIVFAGLLLTIFYSLSVFAEEKEIGFFATAGVGTILLPSSATLVQKKDGFDSSRNKTSIGGPTLGYELGYKIPKIPFRIFYGSYNSKVEWTNGDANLEVTGIFADYYSTTGWVIGIGRGTGKYTSTPDNGSYVGEGTFTALRWGWGFQIDKNIDINFIFLYYEFGYERNDYSYSVYADPFFIGVVYHF